MAAKNLELWNDLEKTDRFFTKEFQRPGGFRGTSINSTYVLKRLTEAFGPCGKGWRFVMDNEEIVEGPKMKSGDARKLHKVLGHIEYLEANDWKSTSVQFGQTMLVDENKYGPFMDEEAPKKSITDCLSKCAVMLGIGADVYLGLFDDNKYVNDRKREADAERKSAEPAKEQGADKEIKTSAPAEQGRPKTITTEDSDRARALYNAFRQEIDACKTEGDVRALGTKHQEDLVFLKEGWPKRHAELQDLAKAKIKELAESDGFGQ